MRERSWRLGSGVLNEELACRLFMVLSQCCQRGFRELSTYQKQAQVKYSTRDFLCNIQTTEGIIAIDNNVQMRTLLVGDHPLDNKLQCRPTRSIVYCRKRDECHVRMKNIYAPETTILRRTVRSGLTMTQNDIGVDGWLKLSHKRQQVDLNRRYT